MTDVRTTASRGALPVIQDLRGFAAVLVLMSHALLQYNILIGPGGRPLTQIFDGSFGVDVFFVISGFIMYYISHDKFARPRAPGDFLLRRLIRIVPLYWIATALQARHQLAAGNVSWGEVIQSFLFIPYDFHDGKFRPVLAVGWSLNYEMLFYAIFFVALFLKRRLAIGVIFGSLALLVIAGMFNPQNSALIAWTRPVILQFALGALIGMLALSKPAAAIGAWLKRPLLLIVGLLVLEAIYFVTLHPDTEATLGWRPVQWSIAGLIVCVAVLTPSPRGGLVHTVTQKLGDASYSIYLFHTILLSMLANVWEAARLPTTIYIPIAILACCLVGVIIHELVERPLLLLLNERRIGVPILGWTLWSPKKARDNVG
jgi:exopolysaccharide production protein ExoZ